jgi:hypothetical protein
VYALRTALCSLRFAIQYYCISNPSVSFQIGDLEITTATLMQEVLSDRGKNAKGLHVNALIVRLVVPPYKI